MLCSDRQPRPHLKLKLVVSICWWPGKFWGSDWVVTKSEERSGTLGWPENEARPIICMDSF